MPTPAVAEFLLAYLERTQFASPRAGEFARHAVRQLPADRLAAIEPVMHSLATAPAAQQLAFAEGLADKVRTGSRVMAEGLGTGAVIKLYPSITAGKVTVDVDLPGIDNRLIGRRVAAKVETGTRKALLLPSSYIITRYGIDYVTLLSKNGTASEVPVQTTPAEPGKVEILSGANAGDTLVGPVQGSPRS